MLARLPRDLQGLVCGFLYDANLMQTIRALELKSLNLHPVCINESVNDYSGVRCPYTYCRDTQESSFFAPWRSLHPQPSPFRQFFVWFARSELWAHYQICAIIDDLDFRCVKKHMEDCPVSITRSGKYALTKWVYTNPTDACVYLSDLFRRISIRELRLHPGGLSRFVVSEHASSTMDWDSPCPLHSFYSKL